jgi:plastocyanin
MNRQYIWLLAVALLLNGGALGAADVAGKVGIVKGTITVAGKPTDDVVGSLEGAPTATAKVQLASKPKKAVMDQKEMKFIPYLLPVVVGTTVDFPNHDTNWHNVYSKGGPKDFDLGLYAPGKTRSMRFDKPGTVRILCNAHPNMEAFIVVKEHPYFSAADKGGNYRIDRVPLGKYRIQVWHPQLGITEAPVELVRDGEVLDVNFDLKNNR